MVQPSEQFGFPCLFVCLSVYLLFFHGFFFGGGERKPSKNYFRYCFLCSCFALFVFTTLVHLVRQNGRTILDSTLTPNAEVCTPATTAWEVVPYSCLISPACPSSPPPPTSHHRNAFTHQFFTCFECRSCNWKSCWRRCATESVSSFQR